jgi:hypothetical protein
MAQPFRPLLIVFAMTTWAAAGLAADSPRAILDKAIEALGGADKLKQAKAIQWKAVGKLSFATQTLTVTMQDRDHFRSLTEEEWGVGNASVWTEIAGDKGRERKEGTEEGKAEADLTKEQIAQTKSHLFFDMLPFTLLPLRDPDFKLELAGTEAIGGQPAVGIQVTPPAGKPFTLHFDKASGRPVRASRTLVNHQGEEFVKEFTFKNYKDYDGIRVATPHEVRIGKSVWSYEVVEFKIRGDF